MTENGIFQECLDWWQHTWLHPKREGGYLGLPEDACKHSAKENLVKPKAVFLKKKKVFKNLRIFFWNQHSTDRNEILSQGQAAPAYCN